MDTPRVNHRLDTVPMEALDGLTLTPGAPEPLEKYAPVVALTLTSGDSFPRKVLIGVRDAQMNKTHPDVISSPTGRISATVEICDILDFEGHWNGQWPDWLIHRVKAILEEKLSLMVSGLQSRLGKVAVWQADSVIGSSRDGIVTESLTMINVHVDLSGQEAMIPDHTQHYRDLHWINEVDHGIMTSMRNPAVAGIEFRGAAPIVYGLCTHSTMLMLGATQGIGKERATGSTTGRA